MRRYSTREVCQALGCTTQALSRWRKAGLPSFSEKPGVIEYDANAVAQWLIGRGIAVEPEADEEVEDTGPSFQTRAEVARYFGVNPRTIAEWLIDPTFPGHSGQKATGRGGFFPAKAIAVWIQNNGKKAIVPDGLVEAPPPTERPGPTVRDRLTEVRTSKAQLELSRMQGQLLDASEVHRFYQRTNTYVVSVLTTLASRTVAALPSETTESVRRAVYEVADKVASECRILIAELLEGDEDVQATNGHK